MSNNTASRRAPVSNISESTEKETLRAPKTHGGLAGANPFFKKPVQDEKPELPDKNLRLNPNAFQVARAPAAFQAQPRREIFYQQAQQQTEQPLTKPKSEK